MATTLVTIDNSGVTIELDGGTVTLAAADFMRIAQRVVGRRTVEPVPVTAPPKVVAPKPAPTTTTPPEVISSGDAAKGGSIAEAIVTALGQAEGHTLRTGALTKAVSEARGRETSGGAVNASLVSLLAAGRVSRDGSTWALIR